ncbi:MAG: N-acetylmuramoyl-L-alanine amidase [Prevotella sp.]|nr:N-acetylmuramoyl-L-alanine amidase [Prevotella sp.]
MLRRLYLILMFFLLAGLAAGAAQKRKFVLVIDAGHGGRDAGAVGAVTKEKALTLKYALAFGEMVERNCPDVTVVYTRKTDRFLELWQRAEIANKQKADLFISVHINSLPRGHVARGFQTYTLGRGRVSGSSKGFVENLEVAKRENAVILLEDNYQQRYQGYDPNSPESDIMFEFIQDDNMERSVELAKLMQRYVCQATGRKNLGAHQDNLAVLRLTSMPACLLELGFISTKDEEAFMNSRDATDKYARGMYNAFVEYKKARGWAGVSAVQSQQPVAQPEKKVQPETKDPAETPAAEAAPAETAAAPVAAPLMQPAATASDDASAPVFKVQIMTSDRQLKAGDSRFKGLTDIDSYKERGIWKYTVGASTDYNAIYRLRREVAGKFPQAFIIAFKNGEKVDTQAALQEFKQKRNKK